MIVVDSFFLFGLAALVRALVALFKSFRPS